MAWKPGESGNVAGRPKDSADLRARLRALTPKAIEILTAVLESPDIQLKDKVAHAKWICERCIPAESETSIAAAEEIPAQSGMERLAAVLVRPRAQLDPNKEPV